ncbi:MAG TPA: response regulator transcription factor [Candidatus Limnocylindria bacterium]
MILVFDRDGAIFATLRELELDLPLWRVTDPSRLEKIDRIELAIVAVYEDVPWDLLASAERPFDTLVLTKRYDEDEALDALGRGLIGYLDANAAADSLRTAILSCLEGEPGYGPRVLGRWLHAQNTCVRAHCNVTRLTDRQREVLDLIAEGLADKEIAERLGIATATAQKHVTNILERLHVANRAAAAAAVCRLVTRTASAATKITRLSLVQRPLLAAVSS